VSTITIVDEQCVAKGDTSRGNASRLHPSPLLHRPMPSIEDITNAPVDTAPDLAQIGPARVTPSPGSALNPMQSQLLPTPEHVRRTAEENAAERPPSASLPAPLPASLPARLSPAPASFTRMPHTAPAMYMQYPVSYPPYFQYPGSQPAPMFSPYTFPPPA
jgi:hypothetical protein